MAALMVGCSQMGPTDSSTSDLAMNPPQNPPRHDYVEPAAPPPGYAYPTRNPNYHRVDDIPSASAFIVASLGGECWLNGSGVVIQPNAISSDQWIFLYEPSENELYMEFENHGLVFDGAQYARISYAGWNPPQGTSQEDLVVWYWNAEELTWEYIGGNNNVSGQYIEFDIYHFSRYIVAGPRM
ncbi:MAG: hypothetical protein C4524_00810 [Candidatus Zixiibacteriota bacterium]|nr:MAG: hypothetical protein C4524_00810 [candidate division Zixibacteria bacterium]